MTVDTKYVCQINNGKISIDGSEKRTLTYGDERELIETIKILVSEGYAFVDEPHGWPPAAVLSHLKERGFINRPFKAISWDGPLSYRIYEVT